MSTTTNLLTLKINYLTQAQYETALNNGQINPTELYCVKTPKVTIASLDSETISFANSDKALILGAGDDAMAMAIVNCNSSSGVVVIQNFTPVGNVSFDTSTANSLVITNGSSSPVEIIILNF